MSFFTRINLLLNANEKNVGNQIHNFFPCLWELLRFHLIDYGSVRQKVTVPTVSLPQHWLVLALVNLFLHHRERVTTKLYRAQQKAQCTPVSVNPQSHMKMFAHTLTAPPPLPTLPFFFLWRTFVEVSASNLWATMSGPYNQLSNKVESLTRALGAAWQF